VRLRLLRRVGAAALQAEIIRFVPGGAELGVGAPVRARACFEPLAAQAAAPHHRTAADRACHLQPQPVEQRPRLKRQLDPAGVLVRHDRDIDRVAQAEPGYSRLAQDARMVAVFLCAPWSKAAFSGTVRSQCQVSQRDRSEGYRVADQASATVIRKLTSDLSVRAPGVSRGTVPRRVPWDSV
jgi:hypothetical protein